MRAIIACITPSVSRQRQKSVSKQGQSAAIVSADQRKRAQGAIEKRPQTKTIAFSGWKFNA